MIRRVVPVSGAALLLAGLMLHSNGAFAADENNESRIQQGFKIAPVSLNVAGKNRALVGYGSYLVNAVSECNGCHSQGPQTQYLRGGNPYFNQHPVRVNPATYLGGGRDFGPVPAPGFADIVSRNLTPDKSGKPAGLTLAEFMTVIRTGVDLDKWHPTCSGAPDGHCVPAPFDGSLLQVMPWPAYQDMTDFELRAIYEYLSAIPCLEGDPGNPAGSDTGGARCH